MNEARYQRWLALALLGLVLFTVIFLVLLPLFSSWLDYREQKKTTCCFVCNANKPLSPAATALPKTWNH